MSDNQEVDVVQTSEVEVEAKKYGWKPKDEYTGNPDDWKPAEEFMRRGKEINGFLRAENEKILKQLRQRDAEIAEIRQTISEFAEHHKKTKENAYKEALAKLRKDKAEAVEQSDGERVVEIDEQIEALKEAQQSEGAPKTEQKAATAPAMTEADWNGWVEKNEWYGQDEVLTALANGLGDKVKAKNPDLVGLDFLDAVAEAVRKAMPEAFENPARKQSTVAGAGENRPAGGSKKKSYNDLPADAKVACDKYVKEGLLTREQYVADYFDGE